MDSYDNLILLCGTHHTQVDEQRDTYTVSKLRELKRRHEQQVRKATEPLPTYKPMLGDAIDLASSAAVEKKVGVIWSQRADIAVEYEVVRFKGQMLARQRTEDGNGVFWEELYRLSSGSFIVYTKRSHRFDFTTTSLHGASMWDEVDSPMTLDEVQSRFPSLASAAGLPRIQTIRDVGAT